jgi:hypothetical protein
VRCRVVPHCAPMEMKPWSAAANTQVLTT